MADNTIYIDAELYMLCLIFLTSVVIFFFTTERGSGEKSLNSMATKRHITASPRSWGREVSRTSFLFSSSSFFFFFQTYQHVVSLRLTRSKSGICYLLSNLTNVRAFRKGKTYACETILVAEIHTYSHGGEDKFPISILVLFCAGYQYKG